uniref:Uncharacterized protein n=1 Tax=Rhizophora mucronata TaxID=61149 RepID=A0A2P2ND58_RHIMU
MSSLRPRRLKTPNPTLFHIILLAIVEFKILKILVITIATKLLPLFPTDRRATFSTY